VLLHGQRIHDGREVIHEGGVHEAYSHMGGDASNVEIEGNTFKKPSGEQNQDLKHQRTEGQKHLEHLLMGKEESACLRSKRVLRDGNNDWHYLKTENDLENIRDTNYHNRLRNESDRVKEAI